MMAKKWSNIADHPAVYLILGDVGEGKTVTACSVIDEFHHTHKLKTYMVADEEIVNKFPKWFKYANPQKPRLGGNSIIFLDDAHLYHYAREWGKGKAKTLDFIARERRHSGNTIVYTTQQSRVLDVNLISMSSCLVFKRPSKLQLKVERKFVKDMFTVADNALKEDGYKINRAYVVAKDFEGLVTVNKPTWFTDRMSKAHSKIYSEEKKVNPKSMVKPILKMIKKIGGLL